jgi:hypothetical protein
MNGFKRHRVFYEGEGTTGEKEVPSVVNESKPENKDQLHQGRDESFMDIDRMVNEGLGGGNVTLQNGLIEATTTDTMDEPESIIDEP